MEPVQIPKKIDEAGAEPPANPRGKYHRVWVTLGIIITCVSLMAIVAVANRPGIKTLLDEGGFQETLTEVNIDDAPIKTEVVDLPTVAPNEDIVELTDGPAAHLERGAALVEDGKLEEASKEYMIAGELFLQFDQPVNAAGALLQATILHGELDRENDRKLISLLTQALFYSAPYDEIDQLSDAFPSIDARFPVLHVLEARRLIFTGDHERAQRILDDALARDQENYLAKAVQAELLYAQGEFGEAGALINEITNQPGIYPWLRDHLHALEENISKDSS